MDNLNDILNVDIASIQGRGKQKSKKRLLILVLILLFIAAVGIVATILISKNNSYTAAITLLENREYDKAHDEFLKLGSFKDSPEMVLESLYQKANAQLEENQWDNATENLTSLGDYKDSAELLEDIPYRKATLLLENNAFDEATEAFTALGDYKDSKEIVADIPYQQACYFAENSMDDEALEAFAKLGDYKDSLTKIKDITYSKGCALLREKSYQEAYDVFCSLGDYRDSNELAEKAKKEIAQLLEEKKTTSMSEKSKLSLSKLWDGNYLDYDYDPVEKVFKPSGVFSTYCEWTINVKDNNVIQRYTKNDFGQDQSWSVSYSIISIDSQYATIKDIVGENILLYRNDGKIFINFPQNDSAEYNAYLVKKS